MKVYSYHPVTGEYMGETIADESPLEPGKYLLPAYTTKIAPPTTGKNEAAVFANDTWRVVPDWRDEKQYKKTDGSEVTFKLDEQPDDTMTDTPRPTSDHVWGSDGWEVPLGRLKELKLGEISAAKWAAIEQGAIEYEGLHFHTDATSQGLLSSNVQIFREIGTLPQVWKAKDGYLPITSIDQLTAIGRLVAQFVEAQFGLEFSLATQVNAAATIEAVEAITWPK